MKFAALAGVMGLLAGVRTIYELYQGWTVDVVFSVRGVAYLLARSVIPVLVFIPVARAYGERWDWLDRVGVALIVGCSAEVILRAKIQIWKALESDGSLKELAIGPVNYLDWLVRVLLDEAKFQVDDRREELLKDPPTTPPVELMGAFRERAADYPSCTPELLSRAEELFKEWETKRDDVQFRKSLGRVVINNVGPRGLVALLGYKRVRPRPAMFVLSGAGAALLVWMATARCVDPPKVKIHATPMGKFVAAGTLTVEVGYTCEDMRPGCRGRVTIALDENADDHAGPQCVYELSEPRQSTFTFPLYPGVAGSAQKLFLIMEIVLPDGRRLARSKSREIRLK